MYGMNELRHQNKDDDGQKLKVYEIFASIQGEGPYAGQPAIFIRLSGCMLQCTMCDTNFDSPVDNYESIEDIIFTHVKPLAETTKTDLVVLTGGEPLLQNIVPLINKLLWNGFRVQIETAGSKFFNNNWNFKNSEWLVPYSTGVLKTVTFVCSPKTRVVDPNLEPYIDAWKYIIRENETSEEDGLPNCGTQKNALNIAPARPLTSLAPIYVQPLDEKGQDNTKYTAAIAMKYGYRLSLQLHKIIGLP